MWKQELKKFRLTKDADEQEINEFVEDILNGKAFDRKLSGKKSDSGHSYTNRFNLDDLQRIADRLNYRMKWLKDYYAKDNDGGLE